MRPTLLRLVESGSPFELIREGGADSGLLVFRHAPATLSAVYQKAHKSAHRPFLSLGDQQFSYGDVLLRASVLARTLIQRDKIQVGQRVAIILPSGLDWLVAFIAVTSIGGTAVLVVPTWNAEQLAAAMLETACRTYITDLAGSELLSNQSHGWSEVRLDADGFAPTGAAFQDEVWLDAVPLDGREDALIAFTSGSTSIPKGVLSTHRAVIAGMMNMMLGGALASARQERSARRVSGPPSSLLLAPFAHISGYSHLLLMMWVAGHVFAMPAWNCQRAVADISRSRIRSIIGLNPDSLGDLLQTDLQAYDLSCVTALGLHGMALTETIREQVRSALPAVELGTSFGMTETNGSVCVASAQDLDARRGTCGFITPSVQVRIVSGDGANLPPGADGEVWIRGAMLMSKYCTSSPLDSSFVGGGWFRTGDRGHIDEDHFLYLTGRCRDFAQIGAHAFSCAEIEAAVRKVVVEEVAVLVDETETMIARVVVVIASGGEGTADDPGRVDGLHRLAREMRCEMKVVRVERLPRTITGKVDRRALRATYF